MIGDLCDYIFGGGTVGMLLMLLFWVVMMAAISFLMYVMMSREKEKIEFASSSEQPEQVLLNEFMRGHINEEEYLHKKKYL
ncbi:MULTISPECIES: hypothetical protein [Listeria]|uniref:hypothetical protein n=1 Tax=Listeria TaxID=1637 RepID=UPI000B58AA1A|nr:MULTISPECIES: hypothetical protein [Listeria]